MAFPYHAVQGILVVRDEDVSAMRPVDHDPGPAAACSPVGIGGMWIAEFLAGIICIDHSLSVCVNRNRNTKPLAILVRSNQVFETNLSWRLGGWIRPFGGRSA